MHTNFKKKTPPCVEQKNNGVIANMYIMYYDFAICDGNNVKKLTTLYEESTFVLALLFTLLSRFPTACLFSYVAICVLSFDRGQSI